MRHILKLGAAITFVLGTGGCDTAQPSQTNDTQPAYILSEVEPENRAAYREYLRDVQPVIQEFDGRVLVRSSSSIKVIEGRALEGQITLLEFPSAAHRDRFWESREYREIEQIRQANAVSRIIHIGHVPADEEDLTLSDVLSGPLE